MNELSKKIIDEIKKIRKERGLSQTELAKKCNVPQSTIGRIENYSMNPSIDNIINIVNAMDITIELKDKTDDEIET